MKHARTLCYSFSAGELIRNALYKGGWTGVALSCTSCSCPRRLDARDTQCCSLITTIRRRRLVRSSSIISSRNLMSYPAERSHPPAAYELPNGPYAASTSQPNQQVHGRSESTASLMKPQPLDGSLDADVENRYEGRTPSPTPEEASFLAGNKIDWKKLKSWHFWLRKDVLRMSLRSLVFPLFCSLNDTVKLIITLVLVTFGILFTVLHKQFVHWFQPTANKLKE